MELNGDKIRKGYEKVKALIENPMDFIKQLLTVRALFDRYVVKLHAQDEEDENLDWILHRPYRSSDNTLKYKNTFSENNNDVVDGEDESFGQKKIIKQLSMLQVSFRNQKYKNWLFDYLKWLNDNYKSEIESVKATDIERFLDNWIEGYYSHHVEKAFMDENGNKLLRLGVDTPHFLFNYIDYLYWLESLKDKSNVRYIDAVKDFKFKYNNSVEHHRPQSYDNKDIDIDCIGNLCLISRRNNSSLNDKDAREKAKIDIRGLQPKRKVMYEITNNDDWGKIQIEEHNQDIVLLLQSRLKLLKL